MGKLLRVDMGRQEAKLEQPRGYEKLGGRALTSTVVAKEVPPTCHALSEANKLVIASGLLTGTMAANSGRLSVGAKSPLTGGIKESNVGGNAAFKLERLGIRGIIVEGKPPQGQLHYLVVSNDGASLESADEYRGLKNYDLCEKLKAKHGDKVGIICIGPAGEMRMCAASVAVTDTKGNPSRHAGRGGMGAVMGSKGLKAIVIDDRGAAAIEYHDRDGFREAAGVFRDAIRSHDVTKPGGTLSEFGTNALVNVINEAGAYPTRNFSSGQFEGADKISGEKLREVITERGGETTHAACTGCIIQCSNVYLDRQKRYLTAGFEYESIWAIGGNCGIDDLDTIAQVERLCDDLGVDTIEIGCAIAVAMEGGVKEFGDGAGAIELMHEIGNGTPLGRIIGNGTAMVGQALGVARVPVVKGQSMPAYDPRAVKGVGVTYATSPMGADHTAGYGVATNILKVGGYVDPLKPDGQAELSRGLQIATAALDSAGLCVFVAFALLDIPEGLAAIPKMLNARYGWDLTADDLTEYGQDVLRTEREFNLAAGFTSADDRLPDYFSREQLPPHKTVFDVPAEELDQVHSF
jgi:aldehyde:ferredoxin oxidoreductase